MIDTIINITETYPNGKPNIIKTTCVNYIKKIDESDDDNIKKKLYNYFSEYIKINISNIKRDIPLRKKIYDHYIIHIDLCKLHKLNVFKYLLYDYNKDTIVSEVKSLLDAHTSLYTKHARILNAIQIYIKILKNIVFCDANENFGLMCYRKAKQLFSELMPTKHTYHGQEYEDVSNLLILLEEYINWMETYYPERCLSA